MIWHLSTIDGDVRDPASFVALHSDPVDCNIYAGAPTSSLKKYDNKKSGLQYLGNGNWQYNWKTPKTYAGTCQNMYIEFAGGQNSPVVTFRFK